MYVHVCACGISDGVCACGIGDGVYVHVGWVMMLHMMVACVCVCVCVCAT